MAERGRRTPSIPVLDLEATDAGDAGTRGTFDGALRAALLRFGFAAIRGHGIPDALVARVYAGFADFFARPESAKRESGGVAGGQRGYTGFGVEHARDCALPDQKEFFHVGRELPPTHPLARVYPPNVWTGIPGALRKDALDLYARLDTCAGRLLSALARGFGVEPPGALEALARDGNSILRIAHYPPARSFADPRALRASPHEDINLITLLCDATEAGLEILPPEWSGRGLAPPEEAWIPVEVPPGCLVVDSGDMLARVTNGVVPSVTHRVVSPGTSGARSRLSMPFFAHPRPDADLSVLPIFVEPGQSPRTAPITAAAFLDERLREIGLLG